MNPSPIKKRSVVMHGHKTSVSIEDAFWFPLKEIAIRDDMNLGDLLGYIDATRSHKNLSCAIRVFVVDDLKKRVGPVVPRLETQAQVLSV